MREWPTQNYVIQKRNFFARAASRFPLDNVIEAMKGVYSSMRLCQVSFIYFLDRIHH